MDIQCFNFIGNKFAAIFTVDEICHIHLIQMNLDIWHIDDSKHKNMTYLRFLN